MSAHVVVVGGGLAGLTAALDLLEAGCSVTVVDGGDRVGGKLRREIVGGVTVDVGAEAMLAARPEGRALVERLGLGEHLVAPATTSAAIWTRGGLHPIPSPSLMGVPADPEQARGILTDDECARLRAEVVSGPVVGGDVSVGHLVASRLGPAVVDRLVDPLLGGVYAGDARRLSARAAVPALAAAAASGDSLLEAAAALPRRTADSLPVFTGLAGGLGSIPETIAARLTALGGRIRTATICRGLRREGARWAVLVGPTTQEEWLSADAVVVATPAPAATRLLTDPAPVAARLLATIEVASLAIVTLVLDRLGAPGLPGSGLLVPAVDGRRIKAATFSSAKWGWLADAHPDRVVLRTSIGRAGEAAILQRPDRDLVRASLDDLAAALGRPMPEPLAWHVRRWGGALPQYAVGHLDLVAGVRAALEDVPGLAVAGAAYDGVGIPAVIASAHRAASEITTHLTDPQPVRVH